MMLRKFLRGLGGPNDSGGATKTRTLYHWRCECGAHSRGGDPFESDAEYNAQRHQWGKGVDHPMPAVYSTEEEVPSDWPDL
jgi:hypothetical protein